jgi:mRNA interferase RelE/StbE
MMSRSRRGAPEPRPEPRRYEVQLTRAGERGLAGLARAERQRIVARLRGLAENPRPPGAKKLRGVEELYRIRSGDYRVLYQIDDTHLIVVVVDVGNRQDVYRDL